MAAWSETVAALVRLDFEACGKWQKQTSGRACNSFDMVRLIAALGSRSRPLLRMAGRGDPLDGFWGTDEDLGGFAVLIFFGISGYLITESILKGASFRFYVTSRLLRIYPALLVCLCVCILAGIILTTPDSRRILFGADLAIFLRQCVPVLLAGAALFARRICTAVGCSEWAPLDDQIRAGVLYRGAGCSYFLNGGAGTLSRRSRRRRVHLAGAG